MCDGAIDGTELAAESWEPLDDNVRRCLLDRRWLTADPSCDLALD